MYYNIYSERCDNLKFDIIVADPPWDYKNNQSYDSTRGGIPYSALSSEVLENLKLHEIANDDALLFLWATSPRLPQAISFIEANGFEYCTVAFNWIKLNRNSDIKYIPNNNKKMPDVLIDGGIYSGMGYYTNSQSEFVLVGRKGRMLRRVDKSVKQLVFSPVNAHSEKPIKVNENIELLYGNKSYVEIFARVPSKRIGNWTFVGNEVGPDYLDIRDALAKIKNDTYYD